MDQDRAPNGALARGLAALRASWSGSAWGVLVGKIILWLGALAALAYVGTRAAASTLGGARKDASVSALVSAAPSAGAASAGAPAPSEGSRTPSPADSTAALASTLSSATVTALPSASTEPSTSGVTADGRVILNLADETELRKLPSVGARRAQAILELRAKLGGKFHRIEELLRVRGIGPRTVQRWRSLVVLDPP